MHSSRAQGTPKWGQDCFTLAAIHGYGRHPPLVHQGKKNKQLETSSSSFIRNASLSGSCRAQPVYQICLTVLAIHDHSGDWPSRCIQKIWGQISCSSQEQPLLGRTIDKSCPGAGVNEELKDKWWLDQRTRKDWKTETDLAALYASMCSD